MEDPVIWCLSQVEPAFFLWALVVAVAAYFLGCFNGAVIVSKYILRDDVRGHGSEQKSPSLNGKGISRLFFLFMQRAKAGRRCKIY